jgi:probable phosphoglycerate mutase
VSPAARILVIRHGETPSNAARIFQTPDTPLSERGQRQAERLGERLSAHPLGLVLSSDLARAHQTAHAVARHSGAPLELDSLLHERNFGDLRGTPYSEFSGDPFAPDYTPPAGESWAAFHDRVDRAWNAVLEAARRCEGDLAVVTHGLVCRALLERKLGSLVSGEPVSLHPLSFANTSITIACATPPHSVEIVGCVEHLRGIDEAADSSRAAPV